MSRRMKPAAIAAVLSASVLSTAAFAQAPPAGGFNPNDALDILRDTQTEFGPAGGRSYGPGSSIPATLPANVDIEGIRRGLDSATRDAVSLYDSLNAQVRYVPAVQSHLAAVLTLRARAERLQRTIRTKADLEHAVPDLQALDSEWRDLSYRLKLHRLDRTATDLIKRLDATDEQISSLLKLGPSVDYRALVQKTSALATAVDRLIQDIDYEAGRTAEGRQLILEGQRVQQHASHLSDTAFQQDAHDHLVEDFRLFQQAWSPFTASLRKLNSRWVDKSVQNVAAVEREVSAMLWIEQTLDRQQLLYLTDQLTRDVDYFFQNAPLKMLMKLPESDRALATADEFYGVFENFVDCVNRGENQRDLQDAFGYIDSGWRNFARVYRPLNSSEAQQYLNGIEKNVATLRQSLLIQEGFDRIKAAELAAFIENLSGALERDTRNWLTKSRPPYAAEAQRDVASFRHSAQELHEALIANVNQREVRQMSDSLFESWRRVYNHVIKCQTSERPSLAATSSQTTPALVELRTLLAR